MTVSIEMFIITWIIAVIAYIIDGKMKKRMYVTDVNLAKLQAKKELNIKAQGHVNNYRYGIIGEFDYNIKPTDKYEVIGKQTFIGTGIVLDRKHITKGDIVDDMAAFYQKSKQKFVADSKELRDRHIVVMYIQDNLKQFIWDDKDLYNNVDKGDKVSISYNEKGPLSVGYKLKGERDDSTLRKKLDVGRNKKDS